MFKLNISLKRVQTFIFEVPRLKAMLGANALIGQTIRHELPALLAGNALALIWPQRICLQSVTDPLNSDSIDAVHHDTPIELYQKGILARDGGHFIVLFENEPAAQQFLEQAEELLGERLPGVQYEVQITPFPEPKQHAHTPRKPQETAFLDLPVLQVCQETGQGPASHIETRDGEWCWQARSVRHRLNWGDKFRAKSGHEPTRDIIGLLRPILYPDRDRDWHEPADLAQLAAGGYLALIHADGNGIGKRYKERQELAPANDPIAHEAHGEAFFHSMRVAVRRSIADALHRTFTESGGVRPYEVLMLGGDDLLLICRANGALDFVRAYAEELSQYPLADGKPLTVAMGVAIAQKGYPLHRLHELAESLASSAKRLYRALPMEDKSSVIDWQVVSQSWFKGVAEARRQTECIQYQADGQTETLLLTGRPYRVLGADGLDGLLLAAMALDARDETDSDEREIAARSPLRSLRTACEQGRLMAEMAFARLPHGVRSLLCWEHEKLWKTLSQGDRSLYLNRALDIIGLREIDRFGKELDD